MNRPECQDISLFGLILVFSLSISNLFFLPYFAKWSIFLTLTFFFLLSFAISWLSYGFPLVAELNICVLSSLGIVSSHSNPNSCLRLVCQLLLVFNKSNKRHLSFVPLEFCNDYFWNKTFHIEPVNCTNLF